MGFAAADGVVAGFERGRGAGRCRGVLCCKDGWFAATEKSDYIQAIGLSSAKFQHSSPRIFGCGGAWGHHPTLRSDDPHGIEICICQTPPARVLRRYVPATRLC